MSRRIITHELSGVGSGYVSFKEEEKTLTVKVGRSLLFLDEREVQELIDLLKYFRDFGTLP